MKQKLKFVFIVILMIILIIYPDQCKCGTKEGLVLWYKSILPSLLPYMILSNILISTEFIKKTDYKNVILNPNTLLTIFIGLFCGYPMGAYTTSKLYDSGKISKYTAYWLLSFVNLNSPAFILQYVCIDNMNGKYIKEFILCLYISALIVSVISYMILIRNNKNDFCKPVKQSSIKEKDISDCILDAFLQVIKLCGFIVLFSITVKMVTANISTVTIRHIILVGILEQTNGISLCTKILGIKKLSVILISFFISFGSISCLFQTASVCKKSSLKLNYYICFKILYALICIGLMYILT